MSMKCLVLAGRLYIYRCVCSSKVTSKGAGLNPNAKVWQEMPVASTEAVASGHHWPPSDLSEGKRHKRLHTAL